VSGGRGTVGRMSPLRPALLFAVAAAVVTAGALAIASSASPPASGAAVAKITPVRVDGVHLGDTHADLRARGKVGPIRPGCELAENTRSARLLPPLKGSVNYTQSSPRRVDNIAIRGGAKARGVGIGATIAQIKAKFPHAKVIHSTEQVFEVTLVRTPKRPVSGGRITFAVSIHTHKTTIIGVPFIAFCE
jgi:hypothetical protein